VSCLPAEQLQLLKSKDGLLQCTLLQYLLSLLKHCVTDLQLWLLPRLVVVLRGTHALPQSTDHLRASCCCCHVRLRVLCNWCCKRVIGADSEVRLQWTTTQHDLESMRLQIACCEWMNSAYLATLQMAQQQEQHYANHQCPDYAVWRSEGHRYRGC
jgi:hypothetical protein